jgi:hypothetical protein
MFNNPLLREIKGKLLKNEDGHVKKISIKIKKMRIVCENGKVN